MNKFFICLALIAILPSATLAFTTYVSFTVDDTLSEHYIMSQAFDQHGIKATFYVNSARVGEPNSLTLPQTLTMFQNGHEIGGHTLTHPHLTSLSREQQKYEICQDRQQLLDWGLEPKSFAYPFGSDTSDTFKILSECGYNTARDSGRIRTNTSCLSCPVGEFIPPQNPLQMRSVSYHAELGVSGIQAFLNQAQTAYYDTWIMLLLHEYGDFDPVSVPGMITPQQLNDTIEWVKAQPQFVIKTVSEMTDATLQPIYNDEGMSSTVKRDSAYHIRASRSVTSSSSSDNNRAAPLKREKREQEFCDVCPCGCNSTTVTTTPTPTTTTDSTSTTSPPIYPGETPTSGTPYVILTFDFGTSDHIGVANILEQYGMRGVFTVSSDDFEIEGFMNSTEVLDLQSRGHEVASRTKTGTNLLNLKPSQQFTEICTEKNNLAAMGINVSTIAWPSGANNEEVETTASNCGYLYGRDTGGLKTMTSCLSCASAVHLPFDSDAMKLRSFKVQTSTTLGTLFWQVWRAEEYGSNTDDRVLIFSFTTVCNGCSFSPGELHKFLTWLYPRYVRGTIVTTFSRLNQ